MTLQFAQYDLESIVDGTGPSPAQDAKQEDKIA